MARAKTSEDEKVFLAATSAYTSKRKLTYIPSVNYIPESVNMVKAKTSEDEKVFLAATSAYTSKRKPTYIPSVNMVRAKTSEDEKVFLAATSANSKRKPILLPANRVIMVKKPKNIKSIVVDVCVIAAVLMLALCGACVRKCKRQIRSQRYSDVVRWKDLEANLWENQELHYYGEVFTEKK